MGNMAIERLLAFVIGGLIGFLSGVDSLGQF